jgi:hypothetical protein
MGLHPWIERLEVKRLLSSGSLSTSVAHLKARVETSPVQVADTRSARSTANENPTSVAAPSEGGGLAQPSVSEPNVAPGQLRPASRPTSFLAFRVTQKPYKLVPPFQQVLVQAAQPVPGEVYNVNSISLKNETLQTLDAGSRFTVRMTNQPRSQAFPILTGAEQWKPGQVIVFYVLTKKYYPVSFVAGGFQFNLGGRSSTLVPGPSAIFLRLKYNPATFARTLDWIVAFGQGNQLGQGAKFGIPNTAINAFVAARTHRIDFGGHF